MRLEPIRAAAPTESGAHFLVTERHHVPHVDGLALVGYLENGAARTLDRLAPIHHRFKALAARTLIVAEICHVPPDAKTNTLLRERADPLLIVLEMEGPPRLESNTHRVQNVRPPSNENN
jgi:hypothetical protein